jgi:hypothetical protein
MKQPHPKFSKDVGPRPYLNIEFGSTELMIWFWLTTIRVIDSMVSEPDLT